MRMELNAKYCHERKKLIFHLTCSMFPEQYDVYYGSKKVAYVRLRFGSLTAEIPDVPGREVFCYSFENGFKGNFFDENERNIWLNKVASAILKSIKKEKKNGG
jgi:hypothetical protein